MIINVLKLSRFLVPLIVANSLITPVLFLTSCKKEQNYIGNADGTDWKGYISGNLTCTKTNDYAMIISNTNYVAKNLIIPENIKFSDGSILKLKKIGIPTYTAFHECVGLSGNLIIPDSVIEIGALAFSKCSNLNGNLTLSKNLEIIETSAFNECKNLVGNLNLPNSLKKIGNNAFCNCSGFSGNLIIPEGLKEISIEAFKDCNGFNGKLIIPNNVDKIQPWAFANCDKLKLIHFDMNKKSLEISYNAFTNCKKLTQEIVVPVGWTITPISFDNCPNLSIILNSVISFESNGNNSDASSSRVTLTLKESIGLTNEELENHITKPEGLSLVIEKDAEEKVFTLSLQGTWENNDIISLEKFIVGRLGINGVKYQIEASSVQIYKHN